MFLCSYSSHNTHNWMYKSMGAVIESFPSLATIQKSDAKNISSMISALRSPVVTLSQAINLIQTSLWNHRMAHEITNYHQVVEKPDAQH